MEYFRLLSISRGLSSRLIDTESLRSVSTLISNPNSRTPVVFRASCGRRGLAAARSSVIFSTEMGACPSSGVINSLAAAIDVNHPPALCKQGGSWLSFAAFERSAYFRTRENRSLRDFRIITNVNNRKAHLPDCAAKIASTFPSSWKSANRYSNFRACCTARPLRPRRSRRARHYARKIREH